MTVIRTACVSLCLAAMALAADEKGTGLPKFSPFETRGNGAPAAAAANENVEFAGVSSVGKKTDLIFYDKTAKKSHWIGVGETKEGIAVLNYDQRRELAVVKVNGVEKTLALRKGRGPVNSALSVPAVPVGFNTAPAVAPAPAYRFVPATNPTTAAVTPTPAANPAPPKQDGPPTPETQAKQETEARMLVSDLLEIGMAQRKAYEEAQRKAAEGNAQPAQGQPSAPAPTENKPNGN
jgi:hypothetical protein